MRILFFAQLKHLTRCGEFNLPCGDLDADGLWTKLIETYPQLNPMRASVRLARNAEYVGSDARFADTDEVALIPPVSGG